MIRSLLIVFQLILEIYFSLSILSPYAANILANALKLSHYFRNVTLNLNKNICIWVTFPSVSDVLYVQEFRNIKTFSRHI